MAACLLPALTISPLLHLICIPPRLPCACPWGCHPPPAGHHWQRSRQGHGLGLRPVVRLRQGESSWQAWVGSGGEEVRQHGCVVTLCDTVCVCVCKPVVSWEGICRSSELTLLGASLFSCMQINAECALSGVELPGQWPPTAVRLVPVTLELH